MSDPTPTPAPSTWIVTTAGDRPAEEVARDLARAGLAVSQVLDAVGVITGTGDARAADAARAVRGVTDVSPDQPVDLGPPGAPTTW